MKFSKFLKNFLLFFFLIGCFGLAISMGQLETNKEDKIPKSETKEQDQKIVKDTDVKEDGGSKEMGGDISDLPISDSFSFMKSLMALTFVLGLIFLAAFLFKKIMGINTSSLRTQRVPIRMVGNLPLGDKKFLSVVEIQGKHYFIGVSQNSINLLSQLELDLSQDSGQGENKKEESNFESIFQKARSLLKNQHHLLRIKK